MITSEMKVKLARTAGRNTRYLAVATDGTRRVVLGLSARKSKSALLELARAKSDELFSTFDIADEPAKYSASLGWQFGTVRVYFQMTERDAILTNTI
jgi:hypothetical protein